MVVYCVAYGCNNLHDKRKSISFHTFPWKRPDIFELWVKAIRRENWAPSKTSRLCGEHFLLSDYQNKPGSNIKILKVDAVPSVFSFSKNLSKNGSLTHRKVAEQVVSPSTIKTEPPDFMYIELPSISEVSNNVVDQGTQTVANPDDVISKLRRQVKTLKQKLKRRDLKLSHMKVVIDEIRKSGYSNDNLNTVLQNYFEGEWSPCTNCDGGNCDT